MKRSKDGTGFRAGLLCAAALMGAVNSVAAQAAQPIRVRLATDARVNYQRLQTAAALACGPLGHYDLARYSVWNRCYRATLQGAIEQVDEPALLALHRQRWGHGAAG